MPILAYDIEITVTHTPMITGFSFDLYCRRRGASGLRVSSGALQAVCASRLRARAPGHRTKYVSPACGLSTHKKKNGSQLRRARPWRHLRSIRSLPRSRHGMVHGRIQCRNVNVLWCGAVGSQCRKPQSPCSLPRTHPHNYVAGCVGRSARRLRSWPSCAPGY